MISFPIFRELHVDGYGLFPGGEGDVGLNIQFQPGLTLVLGANGLGKTTLVTMLYRMCAGPFDIPGLARSGELGSRSTEAREISRFDRRLFAARVRDNAADATATLTMTIGDTELQLTRSLASLALLELQIGEQGVVPREELFQEIVTEAGGLSGFGDWILVLRHLTFYFEDRRALVWDPSAQRQILRLLFLPKATSVEWTETERGVLELDSRMRNLQNALTREEREFKATEVAVGESSVVREELGVLEELQEIDEARLDGFNNEVASLEAERQAARLNALQAELAHESTFRDLERLQLLAIGAAFPSRDETARYLLGKLFAENECLACGHVVAEPASAMRQRQQEGLCVICGSDLDGDDRATSVTPRAISRATTAMRKAAERLEAANIERAETEAAFTRVLVDIQRLNASVAERTARIDALVMRLPPGEVDVHERRSELATLRASVELMKRDLAERRSTFAQFIARINRSLVRRKTAVQKTFLQYSQGFLLEDCALVWAPHRATVGETGEQIEFPAFELAMAGAAFSSPVRRRGPEQVSESQREFVDLAFRMTLMDVASNEGAGTLVIDAPESSLDAVFVTRAADVLTRFADPSRENRLVITSNLIEGDLIPELIRNAKIRSAGDARVVDLLELAEPTAATRELSKEYADVRTELFRRARRKRR